MNEYFVYVMANFTGTIYVGVTSNLESRVWQHQHGKGSAFTARYGCNKLVYYEITSDVHAAIAREKQLKGWIRRRKVALIETLNPGWRDLSLAWQEDTGPSSLRSSG